MSDGVPTAGITDHYMLRKIVADYCHNNKLSLSTFGLGHDFHEILMHDLAEAGGGHYYFIDKPEDAVTDFGRELFTLLSVVAQNAYLVVEYPYDMLTLTTVFGHHYSTSGNKIFIDLKEVHPNEKNGILIKFTVKQTPTTPISFKSSLKYNNAASNLKVSKQEVSIITPSSSSNDCVAHANRDVHEKIAYFSSNALMESAMSDAERNNIESAKEKVKKGKDMLSARPEKDTSSLLQNQYQLLDEYDNHLSNHSSHNMNHVHKKMRYKNYQLRKMKTSGLYKEWLGVRQKV